MGILNWLYTPPKVQIARADAKARKAEAKHGGRTERTAIRQAGRSERLARGGGFAAGVAAFGERIVAPGLAFAAGFLPSAAARQAPDAAGLGERERATARGVERAQAAPGVLGTTAGQLGAGLGLLALAGLGWRMVRR